MSETNLSNKKISKSNDEHYFLYLLNNYYRISGVLRGYLNRALFSLKENSSKNYYIYNELDDEYYLDTIQEMLDEWIYIDDFNNFKLKASEKCQLCGRPDSIYQFRLFNTKNEKELWVGSTCIINFALKVYSEGELIDYSNMRAINKIFNKYKLSSKTLNKLNLMRNFIFEIIDNKYKTDIVKMMCLDPMVDPEKRDDYVNRLYIRTIELRRKGINHQDIYIPTQLNFEKGIFNLKQLKRIFKIYTNYYRRENGKETLILPMDTVKLFKINWHLAENKKGLKFLRPFQWIQFCPIIPKNYFTYKNGFTKTMYNDCMSLLNRITEHPSYNYYTDFFQKIKEKAGY